MTKDLNIKVLLEREEIVTKLKQIAEQLLEASKNEVTVAQTRKLQFIKSAVWVYSIILKAVSDSENAVINSRIDALEERLQS